MAINRKDIVEAIYGSYANVINIPQSRLSWAYTDEDINAYDYNPEEAEKLLTGPAGAGMPTDGL
jgi:peptide/nickel transport system substrate-binding protein